MRDSLPKPNGDAKPVEDGPGISSVKRLPEPDDWQRVEFVWLSKNFAHWPICRTSAGQPIFIGQRIDGRRVLTAELHGGKVMVILPRNFERPRLPNVGDWQVLLYLMAFSAKRGVEPVFKAAYAASGAAIKSVTAKRGKRGHYSEELKRAGRRAEKIEGRATFALNFAYFMKHRDELEPVMLDWRSLTRFMKDIGRDANDPDERRAVVESVEYWRKVRLRFPSFHVSGQGSKAVTIRPIAFRGFTDGVHIRLSLDLLATMTGYAVRVPLPLTVDRRAAGEFNLRLLLMAWQPSNARPRKYTSRLTPLLDRLGIGEQRNDAWRKARRIADLAKRIDDGIAVTRDGNRIIIRQRRVKAASKQPKRPPAIPLLYRVTEPTDAEVEKLKKMTGEERLRAFYGA